MNVLDVLDVVHRYPTTRTARPVLDGVTVRVPENSVLAIVGESGCGKTTLGRLIAGIDRPAVGGTVHFEDQDIWSLPRNEFRGYRRAVQVVQQDPYASLNPGLTVADALRPGLVRHHIVPRRTVGDELLRLLRLVGLDATPAFLHRFPHQLSGGQRQRLAIARALSLRPRLIVADEAVSMLDVSMRVSILDLMLSLRAEAQQLAYVFISHDFGVVRYFARGGRVAVMFYGVIVEEGSTDDVITHPKHPYTYLLLQSIPVPDPVRARRRSADGMIEQAAAAPADEGCVFANRCPFVSPECRRSRPPLTDLGSGHLSGCFFPERVPDSGGEI